MNFSQESVVFLYGNQFFLMTPPQKMQNSAAAVAVSSMQPSSASEGGIVWKTRPGGLVTFIISQHERMTEEFITMLKKMVEYLNMDLQLISFGIYSSNITMTELEGLQSRYAIFFGKPAHLPPQKKHTFADKEIVFLPYLSQIKQDKNLKIELLETMKRFLK